LKYKETEETVSSYVN